MLTACTLGGGGIVVSGPVFAQQVPDAGTILREVEPRDRPLEPLDPGLGLPDQPDDRVPGQPDSLRLLVKGFVFSGNSKVPAEDLQALVTPFTGRQLTLGQLQGVADTVTAYYRQQGFFVARAYLPPQEIDQGIVAIAIIEGTLEADGIDLENPGNRARDGLLLGILEENLEPGEVIEADKFERGLLLLNDLPGLSAQTRLFPGRAPGTGRIAVEVTEGALIDGNLDVDNFGSHATGEIRGGGTVFLHSPTGNGEQITLRGVTSGKGLQYIYGSGTLPVGGSGLRLGLSGSYLNYNLVEEFKALDAEGHAATGNIFAEYPVLRSRRRNLTATLNAGRTYLQDEALGQTTSERIVDTLSLGLGGDMRDDFFGGGVTTASLGLTGGHVDLSGFRPFEDLDRNTADTQGTFGRVNWSVARLQALGGPWSLFASALGQFSTKNLDSSQKFVLGGPYSLRGYPVGEAVGDEGVSVNVDLRYDVPIEILGGDLQLSTFYDFGWIRQSQDPFPGLGGGNSDFQNSYELHSIGVAASQDWPGLGLLRAAAGYQLGNNPGEDPGTGNDSDFSDRDFRIWLQAIIYF